MPARQVPAQSRPLVVAHHDEVELDLLDARHGEGDPVDLLGQLVGARPGGDRQGHFEQDAAPPGRTARTRPELAQRQAELGLDDGAQRGLELDWSMLPCSPSSRVGPRSR